MDGTTGSRGRTWRDDFDPIDGGREGRRPVTRPPVRTVPRRRPTGVLVPDWLSVRLVRQAMTAAVILGLVAAGLRLPFGLGQRLERALAAVLAADVDVERAAAALRELAARGRDWMGTELAGRLETVPTAGDGAESGPSIWIWPVDGQVLTGYGWRDGPSGEPELHQGIDIGAEVGTPVAAAAAGTVLRVGEDPGGYGLVVDIDHGGGWVTRYAHLQRVHVVEGAQVLQGDVIAEVGPAGDADATHLHFEMLFQERQVDPEPKLRRDKSGS